VKPLSWLQQLHDELSLSRKIPLWGSPPSFPLESFANTLQDQLEIAAVQLVLKKQEFLPPEEFLQSFGKHPIVKTFELAPLDGTIHWILSLESIEEISKLLLSSEDANKEFTDQSLQEGFYEYLLLCASQSFEELSCYPDLHIQWLETKPLESAACFTCTLEISIQEKSFPARLIFSPKFHESFSSHFAKGSHDLFTSPLTATLETCLRVDVGNCLLDQKDWNRLQVHDFLVLESCSYDPVSRKGTVILSLENTSLFRAKIKKNGIKILDYYTYYGDSHTMDDENKDEEFFEDSIEDLEDLPLEEEDEQEEETISEQELPKTVHETLSSSRDIPFPIVVEIDRIHMPLEKLLSLQPGNVLELPLRPEQGVYLTVHGKKIARGDLIKIGDAIGVKILEIGERTPL
jgi:flagellar motor switch protein FliN/FliY